MLDKLLFYFRLYIPLPGCLTPSCAFGVGSRGRPGHCTFRACKPAPRVGGGGGPTPHPTSWVWAAPNTPEDPAPVDKSHHLHPHCSRTGKEGTGSAPRPQSSCYRAGHPAEGKEPGETLEVPVSPDEARGPLPGGSASCPLSTPTPAKPRARHPVPYHQPTRN